MHIRLYQLRQVGISRRRFGMCAMFIQRTSDGHGPLHMAQFAARDCDARTMANMAANLF